MKTKNRAQYILGAVVIGCSLVLLAAMSYALTGSSLVPGGRKVQIEFQDATGIKLHSIVRYAGKPAGSVTDLRYLSNEERQKAANPRNAVRVTVQLEDEVPPLLANISARLDAETLLGEKFIALVPGEPGAPLLAEGAVIQGGEVSSIDAVARSAQTAIANVNEILTKLNIDYPVLVPRLAGLLDKGNSILGQGSNLVENVDRTVINANEAVTRLRADFADLVPQITALLKQAQGIATNADVAIQHVNALVEKLETVVQTNEGDIEKIFEELRVVSQNLKVITTYTKSLTAQLAEKPSSLIWGRKKNEIPDESAILQSKEPVATPKPRN
jgi:phospholipid/cholesterol/gamma-HCH transport system substrate-binding protein